MSSHPFDKLPLSTDGALIFTPCPGTKGASLNDSLARLKAAGAEAVITLCERGMHRDQILDQVTSLRPNALKLAVHKDHLAKTCEARHSKG